VYFVPVGWWVATMDAPTNGSSVVLFTVPLKAEVVICANNKGLAIKAKANKKRILLSIKISFLVAKKGNISKLNIGKY
jgi:hypothetical protein